jgi:hypothetical protein
MDSSMGKTTSAYDRTYRRLRLGLGGGILCSCAAITVATACGSSGAKVGDAGGGGDAGSEAAALGDGASDADAANLGEASVSLRDAGTLSISRDAGTPIAPLAFGQNYWDWVDWAGDGLTGVTGTETTVAALGLNVLRAGGNNNDLNGPAPAAFDAPQIDAFVAYCRAVGAEPILQVPVLADVDGGPATAQTAADMVTYANVTKAYGIKYWEIGNEPDLYPRSYDAGVPLKPADLCTVYQSYEPAMKAANAAAADGGAPLTFLGPELSYQYIPGADYLTPFLDACKDYVDVVSVHRYPFGGGNEQGVPGTSVQGALTDVTAFRSAVASLKTIVAGHARPGTPLAITEANISFDYQASVYTDAALVAAPTTFYAGLWTADILGASLQTGLFTLAFWDIGDPASAPSVLGFLQSGTPTPAYYTMKMISANFHGTSIAPVGVPAGFSAYASYDPTAASTAVVVLNKTAPASTLTLAIDSLPTQSFEFPALSATLVQIPDAPGSATHVLRYTQDLADAGEAPIVIQ